MEKQIKAIIFDAGRVLIDWDNTPFFEGIMKFSPYSDKKIKNKLINSGIFEKYHNGEISTRDFYERSIKEINATDLEFEKFCELWDAILTTSNDDIEKIISLIKPNIKLMLLSDTTELHWEVMQETEIIKRFFSDINNIILSFRVGCCKPDRKIYLEAVNKSNYLIEECLFIDDVKENVDEFINMGGNGIGYNLRINAIEDLRNDLARYDVFK